MTVRLGVVVGVGALMVATFVGRGEPATWLTIVPAVLALALLPLLVDRPLPAAVAIATLAAFSPLGTPAATAAVLTISLRRPLRTAVAVGAVSTLAHAVQGLLAPTTGLGYGWWLVLDVTVHAALVAAGALIRARAELVASLRDRAQAAEEDRDRRVAQARTAERALIAREMHDVLAHRLSLVAAAAGALEYRPDAPAEQVARMAGVVRDGVHRALDELRDVIGVLRAGDGEPDRPQPGLADLDELVGQARAAGSDVRCNIDLDGAGAPDGTGRAVYRIVQEGLTNARRHAPGLPVEVEVTGGPGRGVAVELRNRTSGPPGPPGSGLAGMTERAALAGGRLAHGPTGDGGFHVRADLPWPP